jgi:integrase
MITRLRNNCYRIDFHPSRSKERVRRLIHGTKETAERALLSLWLRKYEGLFGWPQQNNTTVADLIDLELEDYKLNNRKSFSSAKRAAQMWKKIFGTKPADSVTGNMLKKLATDWTKIPQQVTGRTQPITLSTASVNKRMMFLLRAYNLGLLADPPLVAKVPSWENLKENAPRSNTLKWPQFLKFRDEMEPWLKIPVTAGWWTGMRKTEVLGLLLNQISFDHSKKEVTIRLESGKTKNDAPRVLALGSDGYEILQPWVDETRRLYPNCIYLCHRNGKHLPSIRSAWERAAVKAGLGKWGKPKTSTQSLRKYTGTTFHDLRRSAVGNLKNAGVDDKTAMIIIGHKTRSMIDRYHIVDENAISEASRKVEMAVKNKYEISSPPRGHSVGSRSQQANPTA